MKLWEPRDQELGLQGPTSPICSVQNEFLTPCSRELHYLWVGQITANPLDYYHYYHTNWYRVCELTQCFHSFSSIAEWVYGNVIVLAINQFIKVSAERPNRFCYAEWIAAPAKPGNEMGNCSCCRLKKSLFSPFWKQLGCGFISCLSYPHVDLHKKMRLETWRWAFRNCFLEKAGDGEQRQMFGWAEIRCWGSLWS